MPRLILPNTSDAKDTIADYLAAFPLDPSSRKKREQIIDNCIKPVTFLIEAVELVSAAGFVEEEVLIHFINALHAQAGIRTETASRRSRGDGHHCRHVTNCLATHKSVQVFELHNRLRQLRAV